MHNRFGTASLFVLAVALAPSLPAVAHAQDANVLGLGAPGAAAQAPTAAPPSGGAVPLSMFPRSTVDSIRSSDAVPAAAGGQRGAVGPAPAPAPVTAPAPRRRVPTDFQRFVATSIGKTLPLFGESLFADGGTYSPAIDVPPYPDYLVGPGDELVIHGWGQVDIDLRAVVSREGTISIPRVGVVAVGGTRYDELASRIRTAVARQFRNFELSVSLGQLRSIQVFVVGQAEHPGVYTVSALSTLMNVLFACGGPSATGSMRAVDLRRSGRLVGTFDLYDVLLKGDKSRDLQLSSGDVIYIPPVGTVAAIAGAVKNPAIYELLPGTKVGDLLEYAGGTVATAATDSLLLERLDQQRGRVLSSLEWGPEALSTVLQSGDLVQIRHTSSKYYNAITLRGTVVRPVRKAWTPGMRVADLISDPSVLISDAYWSRAAARAFSRRAPAGKPDDKQTEGDAEDEDLQHLNTDVENLVDEVNWDYAVVERLDRDRVEPRLIPFNLAKAIIERDPANDILLQPGDIVTVFSKKDIATPAEKRTAFVRVEGEIAAPGVYQLRSGETLRQLVQRVGGLTDKAYLFGAEFNRESVRTAQQARLEEITARAEQELERSSAERLARAVSAEEAQTVRSQIEGQRAALERMKRLRATGRMVLGLRPDARSVSDLPELVLEDGDRVFVPATSSVVGVYGAVYNQSNFVFNRHKKLDEYLADAGGPTRSADGGSTYVLRADGSVFSRRHTGWFSSFGGRELMPSDNIVVPEDYNPISVVKELKDWAQIFYQFGLGVAALKVLGAL